MKIYDLRTIDPSEKERLLTRSGADIKDVDADVRRILTDIRERGDDAIRDANERFDHYTGPLLPSPEEYQRAHKDVSPSLLRAITHAIKNVKAFHEKQLPKPFLFSPEHGVRVGRKIVPLESAGLYIPGGKAIYPSVLIMLGVAARVAGVPRVFAAIPPHACRGALLVIAKKLNITVFKMGGVQAIAAFAYGTKTVPKVDVIAGPGNPYVSRAQAIVRAETKTKIDFVPGPSEGMVFAQEGDPPSWVAADVLSEAEHGPDSAGILVTTSHSLAEAVKCEIENILSTTPEPRKSYILENMKKYSAIIVASNVKEAIDFINEYAPEHLILYSEKYLDAIKHAGTIAVGPFTPITAGNFLCGPNAILPTNGWGRLVSGISVDTFLKKPTIEWLTPHGLRRLAPDILELSDYEGFPLHSLSVRIRLSENFSPRKKKRTSKRKKC